MRKLVIVLSGAGVLLALFLWMKPAADTGSTVAEQASVPNVVEATAEPVSVEPQLHMFSIVKGHRVEGPAVLRVKQGEELNLAFKSDQAAELHLHGYDLHLHLHAGEVAKLSFTAEHAGRFEYELHGKTKGGHSALGVIEVMPR